MRRSILSIPSLLGFLGVAIGAFGAHALKGQLSEPEVEIFKTGTLYHLSHAAVSLALALFLLKSPGPLSPWFKRALNAFTIGIFLFSFSLYLLAVTKIKILGAITPFGGISLMLGWFFIFLGGRDGGSSKV